jgi:hypothetical protein
MGRQPEAAMTPPLPEQSAQPADVTRRVLFALRKYMIESRTSYDQEMEKVYQTEAETGERQAEPRTRPSILHTAPTVLERVAGLSSEFSHPVMVPVLNEHGKFMDEADRAVADDIARQICRRITISAFHLISAKIQHSLRRPYVSIDIDATQLYELFDDGEEKGQQIIRSLQQLERVDLSMANILSNFGELAKEDFVWQLTEPADDQEIFLKAKDLYEKMVGTRRFAIDSQVNSSTVEGFNRYVDQIPSLLNLNFRFYYLLMKDLRKLDRPSEHNLDSLPLPSKFPKEEYQQFSLWMDRRYPNL